MRFSDATWPGWEAAIVIVICSLGALKNPLELSLQTAHGAEGTALPVAAGNGQSALWLSSHGFKRSIVHLVSSDVPLKK